MHIKCILYRKSGVDSVVCYFKRNATSHGQWGSIYYKLEGIPS